MILFDDKGHAGWELAEALGKEESNLNPRLKELEDRGFIFQGPPRKSNRPKKPKGYKKSINVGNVMSIPKREGDYKEIPYFLRKDLKILGSLIKELVVISPMIQAFHIGL
jgi:DNA-binding Lrp family transcriptional regulator